MKKAALLLIIVCSLLSSMVNAKSLQDFPALSFRDNWCAKNFKSEAECDEALSDLEGESRNRYAYDFAVAQIKFLEDEPQNSMQLYNVIKDRDMAWEKLSKMKPKEEDIDTVSFEKKWCKEKNFKNEEECRARNKYDQARYELDLAEKKYTSLGYRKEHWLELEVATKEVNSKCQSGLPSDKNRQNQALIEEGKNRMRNGDDYHFVFIPMFSHEYEQKHGERPLGGQKMLEFDEEIYIMAAKMSEEELKEHAARYYVLLYPGLDTIKELRKMDEASFMEEMSKRKDSILYGSLPEEASGMMRQNTYKEIIKKFQHKFSEEHAGHGHDTNFPD